MSSGSDESGPIPDIAANLAAVKEKVSAAAVANGRDEGAVTLVAVGKTFFAPRLEPAILAGQRVFGENRVQESEEKWPALKEAHPDIVLHLIGPLQRNKVKKAVALFDVIETVDREKLARAIANEIQSSGRDVSVFLQVNTGAEPQKAGVLPDEIDDFVQTCQQDLGLKVRGLMCIPPINEEPALHFGLLRELARRNGLTELSMGMSGDFETAIRFGATHVRVGSAIFGERKKAPAA